MTSTTRIFLIFGLVCIQNQHVKSIYIPGIVPHEYQVDDKIDVQWSSHLTSTGRHQIVSSSDENGIAQFQMIDIHKEFYGLPYFLTNNFKICGFHGFTSQKSLAGYYGDTNLLESEIVVDLSQTKRMSETTCKILCEELVWNQAEVDQFKNLVIENYGYRMFLDDLPSATSIPGSLQKFYSENIPIGFITGSEQDNEKQKVAIFNHLDIKVLIHPTLMTSYKLSTDEQQSVVIPMIGTNGFTVQIPKSSYRIVGFEVMPKSVPLNQACFSVSIDKGFQQIEADVPFQFSYSVKLEFSDLNWPSRFDHYLNLQQNSLNWSQLAVTLPITIITSVALALVIQSAMRKDSEVLDFLRKTYRERWRHARISFTGGYRPAARSDIDSQSVLKREVAWKQLSGDVFRKPFLPLLFSAFMGAGVHVLGCFYTTLFSTLMSTYNPISIQAQLSLLVSVFPFFSGANGYVAARMYKFFNGTYWAPLAIITSTGLPLFLAGAIIVIDICEYIQTKKAIVSDVSVLIFLWLCFNVPITLFGCFLGFSQTPIEVSNKPNRVSRKQSKERTCWLNPILCVLFCSSVPFSVVLFQFYQIFTSIQGGQNITVLYWLVYAAFLILAIIVCEVSIIQNYMGLCYGRYNWWWRTYLYGASISIWLFLTLTYHLLVDLKVQHVTTVIVYMMIQLIICVCGGLAAGTMATFASFVFNTKIFHKIRED